LPPLDRLMWWMVKGWVDTKWRPICTSARAMYRTKRPHEGHRAFSSPHSAVGAYDVFWWMSDSSASQHIIPELPEVSRWLFVLMISGGLLERQLPKWGSLATGRNGVIILKFHNKYLQVWLAFKLPYVYDYITKLCSKQTEVIQKHDN
jgi:hypothetical protein